MSLTWKFNLTIGFIFALAIGLVGFFTEKILEENARDEVIHSAGVLMESALAIRSYTVAEVKPLLALQLKRDFLPQSVPAYAATQNIRGLREKYPEYTYKEATLNPTNPADRATDWEADIIEFFRNNETESEVIGERATPTGRYLYMSRPITITQPGCISCHGVPEDAPEHMLARYGNANGFGWKLGETVGAQVVSVPMSVPLARAHETFKTFMVMLVGVLVGIGLIANILLHLFIVRPLRKMAKLANDISMGNHNADEFDDSGKDEIGVLAQSFNRMRRSLSSAMTLLEQSMPNR